MLDTVPVHGEPTQFIDGKPDPTKVDPTKLHDWSYWQEADVASVMHADGVIRVELDGFSSEIVSSQAAPIMVQAWVHTLQDTLGTRDPVLFRIQGRPFLMYYQVDTTLPIERDVAVPIRHFAGFDTPVDGDVVGTPLALLGYADAAADRPARLEIINLTRKTKEINDRQISSAGPIDLVEDLPPGRHQITLEGIDASGQPYADQIVITVVL